MGVLDPPKEAYTEETPRPMPDGSALPFLHDPKGYLTKMNFDFDSMVVERTENGTPDCLWNVYKAAYTFIFRGVTFLLAITLGFFMTLVISIGSAIYSSCITWVYWPCMQGWKVTFNIVGVFIRSMCFNVVAPWWEAMGGILSSIQVRHAPIPQVETV